MIDARKLVKRQVALERGNRALDKLLAAESLLYRPSIDQRSHRDAT